MPISRSVGVFYRALKTAVIPNRGDKALLLFTFLVVTVTIVPLTVSCAADTGAEVQNPGAEPPASENDGGTGAGGFGIIANDGDGKTGTPKDNDPPLHDGGTPNEDSGTAGTGGDGPSEDASIPDATAPDATQPPPDASMPGDPTGGWCAPCSDADATCNGNGVCDSRWRCMPRCSVTVACPDLMVCETNTGVCRTDVGVHPSEVSRACSAWIGAVLNIPYVPSSDCNGSLCVDTDRGSRCRPASFNDGTTCTDDMQCKNGAVCADFQYQNTGTGVFQRMKCGLPCNTPEVADYPLLPERP